MLKYLLLLNLGFASCASIAENKAAQASTQQADDPATPQQLILGEAEFLYVYEAEYAYDARIDTGATTCSIHAEDIQSFERDGEQWVQFTLINYETQERSKHEKKVVRVAEIKQHGAKPLKRFVVPLKVQLDEASRTFEFSLADRSNYHYPLLVGRNLLRGIAIVDVSQSYTLKKSTQKSIAELQAK
jgi:hypothetical protein